MDELFSMRLTELIENSNYTLDTIAEAANKKAATISRYAPKNLILLKFIEIYKSL